MRNRVRRSDRWYKARGLKPRNAKYDPSKGHRPISVAFKTTVEINKAIEWAITEFHYPSRIAFLEDAITTHITGLRAELEVVAPCVPAMQ